MSTIVEMTQEQVRNMNAEDLAVIRIAATLEAKAALYNAIQAAIDQLERNGSHRALAILRTAASYEDARVAKHVDSIINREKNLQA